MTSLRRGPGLLLWAVAVLVAGCGPMTPAQQEARELRNYCEPNPLKDPDRCYVFIGGK